MKFLQTSREGVFQQPRLVTSVTRQHRYSVGKRSSHGRLLKRGSQKAGPSFHFPVFGKGQKPRPLGQCKPFGCRASLLGKVNGITDLKGMLLYTHDGHMSVQLMYPPSPSGLSNDYVKNGYEASFGSYDVNEQAQTVTHHVEGSITEGAGRKEPSASAPVFGWALGHQIDSAR